LAATEETDPAMLRFTLRHAFITLMLTTPGLAASPAEQRGEAYAHNHCARCHAIDRVTKSPLEVAPPFRALHLRYPIETLAEALAEGISTGHPAMPEVELNPDQIHDLLSYLKTLE
jgi:cytochrome c